MYRLFYTRPEICANIDGIKTRFAKSKTYNIVASAVMSTIEYNRLEIKSRENLVTIAFQIKNINTVAKEIKKLIFNKKVF